MALASKQTADFTAMFIDWTMAAASTQADVVEPPAAASTRPSSSSKESSFFSFTCLQAKMLMMIIPLPILSALLGDYAYVLISEPYFFLSH